MKYDELKRLYSEYFSLHYLNTNDISEKFALISLICYVTYKTKLKKPDVTHYQIIMKLSQNIGLDEDFIKGLSIVCEDFSYGCTEFPTFGLKGKAILEKIVEILKNFMPF